MNRPPTLHGATLAAPTGAARRPTAPSAAPNAALASALGPRPRRNRLLPAALGLPDHPLHSWRNFHGKVARMDEATAWELLDVERHTYNRKIIMQRLFMRASKLRSKREWKEILHETT